MKYLLILIVAIFVILVFYNINNREETSESNVVTLSSDNAESSKSTKVGFEPPSPEAGALIDSLDAVYREYGFSGFCEIKADLDSIFLVSDFMAGALIGADNFGVQRTDISAEIENDKVNEYYKKHKLKSSEVLAGLMLLAMKYPDSCQRYQEYRYDIYKSKIHNELSFDLHVEAHKKYFDLM